MERRDIWGVANESDWVDKWSIECGIERASKCGEKVLGHT